VGALGRPRDLNRDRCDSFGDSMFNAVRIEGCSGYQARLADDEYGGEEKEGSMLEPISDAIVAIFSKPEGRRGGQRGVWR